MRFLPSQECQRYTRLLTYTVRVRIRVKIGVKIGVILWVRAGLRL